MLARVITRFVGWAVPVFFEIERTGPVAPDGPVLVVANHPNALVDPLLIFHTAGRATRPLAKAPLFEQALVGSVLKGLGGLPVYRRQDDPALMHLNDRTFDAAIGALHDRQAVQIYPEGQSHSEPSLTPLRTGAARIALLAEHQRGWRLGLKVQPVGLTYTEKHVFRARAIAAYGEPIDVAAFRTLYEKDEREAVQVLTRAIQERLERLTLNFEIAEDRELVDVAERLYSREKKLARPRQRQGMAERLPRLQRFAEGIRWLRASDPERLEGLRGSVRRYLRLLTLFGASEGDVPSSYRLGSVAWYSLRQLLMLALVLPAAGLGVFAWFVPFFVTHHLTPRFTSEPSQIATYKIGLGLFAFPAWYASLSAAAVLLFGTRTALIVIVASPIAGLAAVAWRDRQAAVREDARVFLRARRRSQARDRLREQRAYLVAEFDAIANEWREDLEVREP